MAEINVERKGPTIWPWVIGLIVLALLVWALMELLGGSQAEVVEEPVTTSTLATPHVKGWS